MRLIYIAAIFLAILSLASAIRTPPKKLQIGMFNSLPTHGCKGGYEIKRSVFIL
jgi:hypothetical protein